MIKGAILLFVASIGVAVAAPLRFYVVPGSGFAMHQPPLWVPDAAASAREAVRLFRCHADLEAAVDSPERVASRQLECRRQAYESAQKKLQNK